MCAGPYHPFGLEFAPPEKVPSRDDDSRRGEKTHRFAFEQKPKGPIFWKGFMKYKYSKDERKKAWEEYRRANGD